MQRVGGHGVSVYKGDERWYEGVKGVKGGKGVKCIGEGSCI